MTESPIKLASVPGSVELDRPIYRQAIDLVKAKHPVHVVSFNEPDSPPAFMHYIENHDDPFAVAIYYQQMKARYFVLLRRISHPLRVMITKLEKEYAKQDKRSHFIRTASVFKPKSGKGMAPSRPKRTGITIRPRDVSKPFPNRYNKA